MKKALKDIPLPNSRELYQLVKAHNNKYTEAILTEKARADAGQNIPEPESLEPAPFEKQLVNERAALASKIVSSYKKSLEMLEAKIASEQEFVVGQRDHSSASAEGFSKIEEDAVDDIHLVKDVHRQLEFAESRFNEMYQKYGRPPIIYIPHWLYIVFAFLIFAGEIPLNALVFQIFGENQVMTWIMAFIIGLSVPVTAHFIGIKYREHEGRISWANAFKGTVGLSVIVSALYGLSVMRTTYLGAFKKELGLTDTLVESSMLFFWLNIAVLGAAIMIAYLSHDSVPAFQRAEYDLLKARKAVRKVERCRIKQLKSSRFRKTKLLNGVNRDYRDGLNRINMLKGHYDMLLREGQEIESQCVQGLNQDVEVYRRENLRGRPDGKKPKSFSRELEFPLKLRGVMEKLVV